MDELPAPPKRLNAEERRVWNLANLMFGMRREPDRLAATLSAMATGEEIGRLQDLLAAQGDMVEGPGGRLVPNPLFVELRAHRALHAQLMKAATTPDDEEPKTRMDRSTLGRRLARARWDK